MKMLKAAGGLALLVLAFPGAALAHIGSASVSCSGAQFRFTDFDAGTNSVHYKVVVDNVVAAGGDFVLNESGGSAGTLPVTLTIYGNHDVSAYAWWGPAGTATGETGGSETMPMASQSVACAAAPAPPAAPPAAAPAPAATPPQTAVLGETVKSPARIARIAAQTTCSSKRVRVTIAGRQMRSVALSVNGRHVRTVRVRTGARRVRTSLPMRNRRASQVVTAKVRFRNGAKPRTLSARANRCAQAAVQPQFTG